MFPAKKNLHVTKRSTAWLARIAGPRQASGGDPVSINGLVLLGKSTPETHGFFTIKLFGLSGENFPIIQFYESMNILEQCGLEKHNFWAKWRIDKNWLQIQQCTDRLALSLALVRKLQKDPFLLPIAAIKQGELTNNKMGVKPTKIRIITMFFGAKKRSSRWKCPIYFP